MTYPYTPPYTPTGPFVTGGAPGINAPFLSEIEGWVANFDQPTPVVLNGATAGTATLYQNMTGTFKSLIVVLAGFQNNGGGTQTLGIPTPFTTGAFVQSSDVNTFGLGSSGALQALEVVTALASGGGSASSVTVIGSYSFASCASAFDSIKFSTGAASAHTGLILIRGI